jgi:hypothetical protein
MSTAGPVSLAVSDDLSGYVMHGNEVLHASTTFTQDKVLLMSALLITH